MLKPYLIALIDMVDWAYWTNPDNITAYSTLALFVVTFFLVVVTALYVREVRNQAKDLKNQAGNLKRQADAMEAQSSLIRSQAEAMTRQAETMQDQSSLMLENMEYDRLIKRYDRVNKEMAQLIAQLYSRRKEANLFQLEKLTEKFKAAGANKYNEQHFYYVDFWESIEQKMYLNRSPEFGLMYHNYIINIVDYFVANDKGDDKKKKDLEDLFHKTRKPEFIREIEKRYLELLKELSEIEKELKILGNS